MQAPGCCTVVHIERCMTSAWPGISPGRITHTADRGFVPDCVQSLSVLSRVAMECNASTLKRSHRSLLSIFGVWDIGTVF